MPFVNRGQSTGVRNTNAKLNPAKVRAMRERWADGKGESLAQLCAAYGVSEQTIRNVVTFQSWKHVPRE